MGIQNICKISLKVGASGFFFFFFLEEKVWRKSRHVSVNTAQWHSGDGIGNPSDESGLRIFKYLRRSD